MSVSDRFEIVKRPDPTDRFEVVFDPQEEDAKAGVLERLLAITRNIGAQGTPGYAGLPPAEAEQPQPKGIVQRILDDAEAEQQRMSGQLPQDANITHDPLTVQQILDTPGMIRSQPAKGEETTPRPRPGVTSIIRSQSLPQQEHEDSRPRKATYSRYGWAQDKSEENKEALQMAVDSFQRGSAGLVDLVGGGMIWAGFEAEGKNIRDYAQRVIKNNEVKELYKEFELSDLAGPDFYLTKGVQMVPSLLTLIPLAVGGGAVGGAVGGALGLGRLGIGIASAVSSAVASRPVESAMEAAGTYNSLLDQGASPEQASEAAADVFTRNIALIGMDAAQFALAFAKIPAPLRKGMAGWIRRVGPKAVGFAAGAASEGYEEVLQGYFQELGEKSLRGEVDASILKSVLLAGPEAKEAFVLGTIGGGLFQAVGTAKQALTPQETDAIIQEQIDNASGEGVVPEKQGGQQEGVEYPVEYVGEEAPLKGTVEYPTGVKEGEVVAKGDQVKSVAPFKPEIRPEVDVETLLKSQPEAAFKVPTVIAEEGYRVAVKDATIGDLKHSIEYQKNTLSKRIIAHPDLPAIEIQKFKAAIETAEGELARRGVPVPAEVLAEYPELGESVSRKGAGLIEVQEVKKPKRKREQGKLELGVQTGFPKGGIRAPKGAPAPEEGSPLFEAEKKRKELEAQKRQVSIPSKPKSEARTKAIRRRQGQYTVIPPDYISEEAPAVMMIAGSNVGKDYPGLFEEYRIGLKSSSPVGAKRILNLDPTAKQDYDVMQVTPEFIEKYGMEGTDPETGGYDFDKVLEIARKELEAYSEGEWKKPEALRRAEEEVEGLDYELRRISDERDRLVRELQRVRDNAAREKLFREWDELSNEQRIVEEAGGYTPGADIGVTEPGRAKELWDIFPRAEANPFEPTGDIPKDIQVREDIGPDLMEAARIIAAPARYRKLRTSMRGVFRKPDKIELQDIRWIRTLAHELGHAVDYRLARTPRSIRKRFPDLGVNEMKARAELKRASEYFRPLPEGAKWDRGTPYMRYRAKHTELMADLTGLYLLSPKKARELAPNVAEALESAIAGNGDVKTAIRTVLEPEQVEFIEQRGRDTKTELPPKPEFVGTEADPLIRKEAFDTVKLTSRELEAQLSRTFVFEKRLRKSLTEKERESLTFLIERIGDPRIEGDTFEKVQERATPEVRKMTREARYEQELNRQEANKIAQEAGDGPEWIQYIADYVPHFWVVSRKKALEYAGRWRKSTPHAKQRTFPTFADGVKLDWQPVSYDFAYLYSRAAENNFRAAVTRRFARRIKDMRTTGGEPVMVGSLDKAGPDWVKIDHPVLRHVYARKTQGGDLVLGEGNAYVHPSIARPVKVLLEKPFKGGLSKFVYAVNAAGKSLNVAFSFFHEIALFESSQAVNAKFLNPLRGIFIGPFEARRLGLGFRPHLTHRAGFMLAEKDIYGFTDAAKHGLAIRRSPATIDYARTYLERKLRKLEAGTRKIPALSFITRKQREAYEAYQRHLWDNVHVGLKLFAYNTLVTETLPDLPPDVSVRHAKETVASHVNDAFGGQEFIELPAKHGGKVSWEPATVRQMQLLHAFLFAPDWTFSNIRIAGRPIVNIQNKIWAKRGARYWRNMILTVYGSAAIIQRIIYEIYGDKDPDLKEWAWQNEPGRKWDIDVTPIKRSIQKALGTEVQERRSYIHAGKQFREVGRYYTDFPKGLLQNIGNKSSVLVRLVIEQIAGHQAGSGFPMPWTETAFQEELEGWRRIMAQGKAAGEHFLPFSWQANNFAFAVPQRKGMSRYRAAKHYKDAMMAFADPSWWDKIKGKVDKETKEKAAKDVMREVDAALKANGQDEDSRRGTFNSARSNLRGRYYGKFLKAVEDQDWKAADEYAVILWNLGAIPRTVKQSAERRGEKELWYEKAREVFISRSDLYSRFLNYDEIVRK